MDSSNPLSSSSIASSQPDATIELHSDLSDHESQSDGRYLQSNTSKTPLEEVSDSSSLL